MSSHTEVVLALDQGTTNTKAVAVDVEGRVVARAAAPVGISRPRPGWVEQDATDLWLGAVRVLGACVDEVGPAAVAGVALSNQRESVVAWRRGDGSPVGPVLSWQDTRTAAACRALRDPATDALVSGRTGLSLDPMFSAPKMRWLLDAADDPDVVVGTVDSWLLWRLTGGREHVTELGNASRTLLLDLDRLDWDDELLALFGVPRRALAELQPSSGPFGTVDVPGLPRVPVLAVLADSHAALRGHGDAGPDAVKVTYGTGSSLMRRRPTSARARPGIASTLAWVTEAPTPAPPLPRAWAPTYAWEGNIRYSGAALDWAARLLGQDGAAGLGELAATVPDAGGASLVPAFGGLGAPWWDPQATGTLSGLDAGSTPAHVARAAFEAVAMQVCDVVDAMSGSADRPTVLLADGGASASDLLMQLQADLSGCEVRASAVAELSAQGAARMAAAVLGWPQPAVVDGRTYRPRVDAAERAERRGRWARAVDRARGLPVGPDLAYSQDESTIGVE